VKKGSDHGRNGILLSIYWKRGRKSNFEISLTRLVKIPNLRVPIIDLFLELEARTIPIKTEIFAYHLVVRETAPSIIRRAETLCKFNLKSFESKDLLT
jgi:hypothetical protein